MQQNSGTTRLTAAGVLGTSGKAVRIFNITVISDGTAGVTTVRDGTSSGGVAYDIPVVIDGSDLTGKTFTLQPDTASQFDGLTVAVQYAHA